jgi:hypothetical protein
MKIRHCTILTALAFFGCIAARAQQIDQTALSFDLSYHFTQGDRFQIKQHSQQDSYLTVDGVESRTTNGQDGVLELTVDTITGNQATLTASFKEISLLSSNRDQHISVNTTTDDQGTYNRLFKAMTGKDFTIVLEQNGTVKSVSGLEAIFDQMIAAVPEVKVTERATLKQFLESQYGPEALKFALSFVLPSYPSRSVQLNGSWMNQLYTGGFYSGRLQNYWKLDYGDKYAIKLSNKGNFSTDSTQEVDMGGGQKGFVDLKGEVKGQYVIDPETDWPTMCISHMELGGNYIYENKKHKKKNILVPVRMVKDVSYQFKHL